MSIHRMPVDELIDVDGVEEPGWDGSAIVVPMDFDSLVGRVGWNKAILDQGEWLKGSHADRNHTCTCGCPMPEDWSPSYDHDKECDLYKHKLWASSQCEYIPVLEAFVYDEMAFEEIEDDHDWLTEPLTPVGAQTATASALYGYDTWQGWGVGGGGSHAFLETFKKCRHYEQELTLPDGTIVYPSSMNNRKSGQPTPDLGVYLDRGWTNQGYPAMYLSWPDMSLPLIDSQSLLWVVQMMLEQARAGFTVEFGCIGGHGRTGTLLGVILCYAGLGESEDPVDWVRKNYCSHAIESEKQEWFVRYHHALRFNRPLPPVPPEKTYPTKWEEPKKNSSEDPRANPEMTVVGKCPVCRVQNGGKYHTEGFCCSNSKCRNYAINQKSKEGKSIIKKARLSLMKTIKKEQ